MLQTRNKVIYYINLGVFGYQRALQLQKRLALRENNKEDILLLLEHPPTYTAGRQAHGFAEKESKALHKLGARCFDVDRGGMVTFHGPGQLVGYPILDLRRHTQRMRWYIESLEEVLIRTCKELGVPQAKRSPSGMGVWSAKEQKLGSVGVQNTNWITRHGFALNINIDTKWFGFINACGLGHLGVSSVRKELQSFGMVCPPKQVCISVLVKHFGNVFNCDMLEAKLSDLFPWLSIPPSVE